MEAHAAVRETLDGGPLNIDQQRPSGRATCQEIMDSGRKLLVFVMKLFVF